MMAHNREGSHQTGTFARGAQGWCPSQEPWLLDLHQREEPLKCLALKSNRADIQWSQSAIENWDSLLNKGLKVKVKSLSCVRLFATPWTIAHQVPLFMGFSRQEYWSGLPFPSPGDLPDPGIKPRSPALQADALTSEPPAYMCSIKLWQKQQEYTMRKKEPLQ